MPCHAMPCHAMPYMGGGRRRDADHTERNHASRRHGESLAVRGTDTSQVPRQAPKCSGRRGTCAADEGSWPAQQRTALRQAWVRRARYWFARSRSFYRWAGC
jgi:hypothetical protein